MTKITRIAPKPTPTEICKLRDSRMAESRVKMEEMTRIEGWLNSAAPMTLMIRTWRWRERERERESRRERKRDGEGEGEKREGEMGAGERERWGWTYIR